MNVELLLRALYCDSTRVLQEKEELTKMLQEDVLLIRAVSTSYDVWAGCKMTTGWLSGRGYVNCVHHVSEGFLYHRSYVLYGISISKFLVICREKYAEK